MCVCLTILCVYARECCKSIGIFPQNHQNERYRTNEVIHAIFCIHNTYNYITLGAQFLRYVLVFSVGAFIPETIQMVGSTFYCFISNVYSRYLIRTRILYLHSSYTHFMSLEPWPCASHHFARSIFCTCYRLFIRTFAIYQNWKSTGNNFVDHFATVVHILHVFQSTFRMLKHKHKLINHQKC